MNRATVSSGVVQSGPTAKGSAIGNTAAQDRAEIEDETQDGGEDTPEQGVGHADEEQANADGQAIADVDRELHQQVAADPLGGIADRRRGAVYVAKAEQADHPIAKILTLQQYEDDEHEDNADRRDGLNQGADVDR